MPTRQGNCCVVTLRPHTMRPHTLCPPHNHPLQVPCEWSVKRPIESSKAKDWAFFSVEPPEGTLEPDQRINVRVIFTPVLGRETPYLQVCEGVL